MKLDGINKFVIILILSVVIIVYLVWGTEIFYATAEMVLINIIDLNSQMLEDLKSFIQIWGFWQ